MNKGSKSYRAACKNSQDTDGDGETASLAPVVKDEPVFEDDKNKDFQGELRNLSVPEPGERLSDIA